MPTASDPFDDLLTLHVCPECGWERYVPLGVRVLVSAYRVDGELVACAHYLDEPKETS